MFQCFSQIKFQPIKFAFTAIFFFTADTFCPFTIGADTDVSDTIGADTIGPCTMEQIIYPRYKSRCINPVAIVAGSIGPYTIREHEIGPDDNLSRYNWYIYSWSRGLRSQYDWSKHNRSRYKRRRYI